MTGTDPPAQLLAALILICGFGLLGRRRLLAQITLLQAQACTLAAAAAWAAYTQKAPALLLAAVIILALQGLLLPAVLRRVAPHFGASDAGSALTMPLGLCLLVLAVLLAPLVLAAPLAVMLLGLLVLVMRQDALAQSIGLCAAQAGLMLAAIGLPGLPFVALLAIGALAVPAAVVAGVVRLRPRGDPADLQTPAPETGA